LRLTFDTGRRQLIVITQKFDVLAFGFVQARQQIADKTQCPRVSYVTHSLRDIARQRLDNLADFIARTVVAHDDFKVGVLLDNGGVQGPGKKTRIEGGDDKADKRNWIHGGALKW
jgi:hypothetical protein